MSQIVFFLRPFPVEMIVGTVHRSPSICLTAEKNPRKLQLGDRLMKVLCLKWGPFPPNEVGRIAQHVKKGERWSEGKDGECYLYCLIHLNVQSIPCYILYVVLYETDNTH